MTRQLKKYEFLVGSRGGACPVLKFRYHSRSAVAFINVLAFLTGVARGGAKEFKENALYIQNNFE